MKVQSHGTGAWNRRGFSLVEMLITLALMVIMTVVFTSSSSFSRQKRDLRQCSKNLQTIFMAMSMYATDCHGRRPFVADASSSDVPLSLLIPRGTTDTDIFICPGTSDAKLPAGKAFAGSIISYDYYMAWPSNAPGSAPLISDRQVNSASKKAGEPLFSKDGKKPGNNHHKYGGNVLFVDGQVEKSKAAASFDLQYPAEVKLLNPRH